jgi:NhaP-type Na+/H+ or K+/H+ antiporter
VAVGAANEHVVVWTTIVCVVCSIVVIGLTAAPLTRRWLEQPR